MNRNTIRKFKWYWAWQDESEEAWLGEMSRKGLHLSEVGLPGIYYFNVDTPHDYVYRLDFQTMHRNERQDYLQLFRDAGWEHIGQMSSWQYFRKEAKPGDVNEIFTDVESKIAKYKRLLTFLVPMYAMLIVILTGRVYNTYPYPWWGGIHAFIFLLLVFFTYAIVKLAIRIKQLKKL